jgi:hypothetical protein
LPKKLAVFQVELTLRAVRLKRIEKEFPMFRCAVAFMTVALTALLLGLLEPALAAPDANRPFSRLLPFGFLAIARLADQPSRR